jgi:predicted amidohydrolase YtcJ
MHARIHCAVLATLVFAAGAAAADPPVPIADLVLRGGKIATVDDKRPTAEAMAVKGDRILAVGSDDEIRRHVAPSTRVIDLAGRLAVPGFIEGHGHFVSLGQSMLILDLREARSWDEIVARVARTAEMTPAGEWIVGRGWHQDKWQQRPEPNVEGYPLNDALSRATPKHPVMLVHASGHMGIANARALELAGIGEGSRNPGGGEILRDERGRPTGVLRETAMSPVSAAQARAERERGGEAQREAFLKAVELASDECLRRGVTSFQDAGSTLETIDALRELADTGKLRVRLWMMARDSDAQLAARLAGVRVIGAGNHHFTVRGIKRAIDGALGTHGAWLLEPYEDVPGSSGLNLTSSAALRRTAELALAHDVQLCVHAIGDRANRELLDLYAEVFKSRGGDGKALRWRIEHAQHLHGDDIPRFARLGVIASMQGVHCTSDAPFVVQRLGQRRAKSGAYVWRSLLDAGAVVSNGTDAPVESVDPLACFHASVTRELAGGATFFPEQCMTRQEALRSYTLTAAYAAFEEDQKGSLTPGKLADIVVLSRDILTCDADEIRGTQVDYTIVGGRILHQRGAK